MKYSLHTYLFLLLLACFAASAFAQTPISLGFQTGLNFGNASTSPSVSTSSRTGFMLGYMMEIGVSEKFFIEPGLVYVQKGAEFYLSALPGFGNVTWKFNYLSLPIMLKGKFGHEDFKPILFAGPDIGINLSAEIQGTNNGQTQTADVKNLTETIDFAFDIGAGGEYQISPSGTMQGSIRYSFGLSDIDKSSASWKSSGVQLVVGMKWAVR